MHRFEQELLYDWSNRFLLGVIPYRGVGFCVARYSFYGRAGELQILLGCVPRLMLLSFQDTFVCRCLHQG